MLMSDLSSAEETAIIIGRKRQKDNMLSPTSSTNSWPLFLGKN